MDELSMILALAIFSFFTFITVCLFVYSNSKKDSKYNYIAMSSGFFTVALLSFFFDVKALLKGEPSFLLSYITFFFLIMSISFFVRSLTQLYKIKRFSNMLYYIIVALVLSWCASYLTINEEYVMRNIVFLFGIAIPLVFVFVYQRRAPNVKFLNLISLQALLIYLSAFVSIIYLGLKGHEIDFANPPILVGIFVMIVDTLIITMIFSYIVELNNQNVRELGSKNELLESMFNQVKKISEVDELTKIYNRRKISDILELFYDNYKSNDIPFSILILDVDNFKTINDVYGHLIGDEVLIQTAKEISKGLRNTDILGRWGGDEFIVILPNTKVAMSEFVKEKIHQKDITYKNKEEIIRITFSIGCGEIGPTTTINELIHKADMKMYEEKGIKKSKNETS